MITCISEASSVVQETLRTLRFTMSAARIKNRPVRFLDPQEKLILELKEEIKRLRIENQQLRQVNISSRSEDRDSIDEQEARTPYSRKETGKVISDSPLLPIIKQQQKQQQVPSPIPMRYRDESDEDDDPLEGIKMITSANFQTTSPLKRVQVKCP
jgi:hypothetical protein